MVIFQIHQEVSESKKNIFFRTQHHQLKQHQEFEKTNILDIHFEFLSQWF